MWLFENFKNNIALIDDKDVKLTYKDLIEKTNEFYSKIGKRCLIFILCRNSIDSLIGYVSCIQNKIVPLMLSENIDDNLLLNLISIYHPEYIYCSKQRYLPINSVFEPNDFDEYYLHKLVNDNIYSLNNDLALLLTTSGSTGSPKFVRQSYKNIKSNAKAIVEYLKLDSNERPITSLPMNYTYGLSVINSHLMIGATICVTNKTIMQKEFWTFFKKNGVTSIAGVPYNYEMLDKLRFMRMDLPSLHTMTQAGGKLSIELHEKFAKFAKDNNKKFVVMYGQCEATARMGYLPPEKALNKIGSMGIPIPNGKFSLIDENNNIVNNPEIIGELVYEGDNVTLGYAECGDDLIKGDERNGRLVTGDMAKFDKDGYYYIVGRKKRFLKVYGNRVNLDELERLSKSKYNVNEVAIAGTDDHVIIFCVNEDEGFEIKKYIVELTKLNHAAFNVKKVDMIPHNDSGKVLYNELNKICH